MRIIKDKNAIIRMFHVYKRYETKQALIDISLDVKKNEFLFISGPSGAGKSTLLRLLYLGTPVSEGQILVDGINLARISQPNIPYLRRKIGIIFQDYKLIQTKTVYENVALVLEAMGKKRIIIDKKVKNVLLTVGMESRQDALPPTLSGGEQQRVAVARAIVGDPKIILADEPTGSLDFESSESIMDLLEKYYIRGATIIIATHDKSIIKQPDAKVVELSEGRLLSNTKL